MTRTDEENSNQLANQHHRVDEFLGHGELSHYPSTKSTEYNIPDTNTEKKVRGPFVFFVVFALSSVLKAFFTLSKIG